MKRRVALPDGLKRALHRRHQIARGIGDVGKPRRVRVRRHHDPREIAVIGPRLERARAPRRDRDDRRRPQCAQRRNPVRPAVSAARTTRPISPAAMTTGTPMRRSARARETRSAGVGRRDVRGSAAMAAIPSRLLSGIETFPRAVTRLREILLQQLVRCHASAHLGCNTTSGGPEHGNPEEDPACR
jgi:hypothetical protein